MRTETPDTGTKGDRAALALVTLVYLIGLGLVFAHRTPPPAAPAVPATESAAGLAGLPTLATDTPEPGPPARHEKTLTVAAGTGVEFKYRLPKGATMLYGWTASGPVKFEFHGEPDGARPGYADTYRTGESRDGYGTFVAPSTGIHGWYWENPGQAPVTVSLKTAGFYTAAMEMRREGAVEEPLQSWSAR